MSTLQDGPVTPISFDLHGCTALVTGATGGIGSAIAHAYAAAGADLVLVSDQDLADVEAALLEHGVRVSSIQLDLSERTGRTKALSQITATHAVDVVVNNAGCISRGPIQSLSEDDWYGVIEVNLHAAFDVARVVGGEMVQRGRGSMINIGSLLSFQGGLNAASYAASKHGIAGLTRALANEWGPRGVTVNAIAPGYIQTALTAELHAAPDRQKEITARIPTGRWGTPSDIAGAAVFLASPASSYVNGHVLVVDGGWMSR